MARGVQLREMLLKFRAEATRSASAASNVAEAENAKRVMARIQETLYDEYNWSHLNIKRFIQLRAGQRFYDPPDDLNIERFMSVAVNYGNIYYPIERGIWIREYTIFDPYDNERSEPGLRWDIQNTGEREQFEIWPVPSDLEASVIIEGTKKLAPLIAEDDRCDLDDLMIVLFAAADFLLQQDSKAAEIKLQAARRRLQYVRSLSAVEQPTVSMLQKPRYGSRFDLYGVRIGQVF